MNVFLWILQVLLALHTLMGAFWKFSNTAEQAVPSLAAIPPTVWLGLSIFEIICAIGLVIPLLLKSQRKLVPLAAAAIAGEMVLFCAIHLASGAGFNGQVIYWAVVAVVCAVIVYGRRVLRPL